MNGTNAENVFDPQRWGLPSEAVYDLADRLHRFWERFRVCVKTRTHDTSEYGYHYLTGQLRMESKRTFANIGRQTGIPGQNLHHFMSNSPWSAQAVFRQVQQEIAATPSLSQGGVLILDESADEKAGAKSAGAGRQYNGRLGKVEMSQVGTFLAYANGPVWTWVEGELFLPESWFAPDMAEERQRLGIPPERQFATKVELGWQMLQRVHANRLPFEAVACDDLYGRSSRFRAQMDQAGIVYMADVPRDTLVYLKPPRVGVPHPPPGQRGRRPTRPRVVSKTQPKPAAQVMRRADTVWQRVRVRATERGELHDEFAARRVWTLRDGQVAEEWLVARREADGRLTYALSNAPADPPLEHLAWLKCQRYLVERANQDAKSEMGWDELQAQKYLAWEHHLALTVLATWFVAQTKLEWAAQYARDPALPPQLAVEVLPALSVANVRTLLRAVMPLPQLTPEAAAALVVEHLVNRSRSRKSRMKSKDNSNALP